MQVLEIRYSVQINFNMHNALPKYNFQVISVVHCWRSYLIFVTPLVIETFLSLVDTSFCLLSKIASSGQTNTSIL